MKTEIVLEDFWSSKTIRFPRFLILGCGFLVWILTSGGDFHSESNGASIMILLRIPSNLTFWRTGVDDISVGNR